MATVTRYVNTASSGGDGTTNGESGATSAYASLSAWEAAEQEDAVTNTNTHVVNCGVGSGSAADTTVAAISGWTTNATYDITVQANPADTGGDQRAVMPYSTSIYRLEQSGGGGNLETVRILNQSFVNLLNLQVKITKTDTAGDSKIGVQIGTDANDTSDGCVFSGILVWCLYDNGSNASSNGRIRGFYNQNSEEAIGNVFVNCVAICENVGVGEADDIIGFNVFTPSVLYNCTSWADDSGDLSWAYTGDATYINCIAAAAQDAGFAGEGASSDYCASIDATTTGSNSRDSQTFTFVDAAGGDFHLTGADAGARTYGVDLSGDGTYPFNIDFDGDTRPSTWDIGAHQVTEAAGGIEIFRRRIEGC